MRIDSGFDPETVNWQGESTVGDGLMIVDWPATKAGKGMENESGNT